MRHKYFFCCFLILNIFLLAGCVGTGEQAAREDDSDFDILNAINNRSAIESYLTEQLTKKDASLSVRDSLSEKLTNLYIGNMDADSAKLSVKNISSVDKKLELQAKIDVIEGNYEKSISTLNRISKEKYDASIYNILSIAHMGLKRYVDAEHDLQLARSKDNNSEKSRNNLAFLYIIEKQYSQAEKLLEGVLISNPAYQRARSNLALCFLLQGNSEKASYILSRKNGG